MSERSGRNDFAKEDSTKETTTQNLGTDALHVPVRTPENVETFVQFQWMRLHPCTAIVALSENDDTAPEVQVSKMMPQYQAAVLRATSSSGSAAEQTTFETDEDAILCTSPFFQASGVHVDLCDLFDPPLLSDRLVEHSHLKDSNAVVVDNPKQNVSHKKIRTEQDPRPMDRGNAMLDQVETMLQSVLDVTLAEVAGDTPNTNHLSTTLEPIQSMSPNSLLEYLSSQRILHMLKDCKEIDHYQTLITFLALLAEHGASEILGCHILNVLAPSVLSNCNNLSPTMSDSLKRLSHSFIHPCCLGKLTKEELRALIPSKPSSQALQELVCCTAESYFSAQQQL
mmetsp:Transcript_4142/g.6289  ORF Transcript_4142/g.6289 Transcript_4142/m.6289 type:complete len:340 (+) Transcript_4142:151-1170(+)|eukprot:CAMPEP_0195295352 /NCGR_PEP_ID=MMETSP0707-20130614/17168_1 /TAXON_ID=33640 /ORGANISM="Asterionellopsis glacialis, Strain CCMP134" /LENGTH=339 /DNA_ID=CAMNT_0040356557 /DNA_START=122 /DNA_END=1141 /DNA_ORIENTATION=-